MSRGTLFGMGGMALLAAWAAVGPSAQAASQDDKEKEKPRVSVFQVSGGGRLGVSLAELGSEDVSRLRLSHERGALVREVEADSPAAAAGLKENDVIVRYDEEPVRSAAQLARLVRETPAGRKVSIDVSREGAVQKLTVTLSERSARGAFGGNLGDFNIQVPEPPHIPDLEPLRRSLDNLRDNTFVYRNVLGRPGRLGLSYQELSGQLARYFKVEDGLLVTEVDEGGPAAQAGIKAGDVIVKVNGKTVRNSSDLRNEVGRAQPGSEATITVERDGRSSDLKVKLAGRTPVARPAVRPAVRPRAGIRL